MPNLIKQGEARIVTKNGEVFVNISLELNIKLEGTGIQGAVSASGAVQALPKEDKVNWAIQDFEASKIDFGK